MTFLLWLLLLPTIGKSTSETEGDLNAVFQVQVHLLNKPYIFVSN